MTDNSPHPDDTAERILKFADRDAVAADAKRPQWTIQRCTQRWRGAEPRLP